MKRIIIYFLLAGSLALSGCASLIISKPSSSGSTNSYSENDARITNRVTSALVRDKQIPALDIKVTTRNAVVTLSGNVSNVVIRTRAGNIAASASGVKAVRNYLRVVQ